MKTVHPLDVYVWFDTGALGLGIRQENGQEIISFEGEDYIQDVNAPRIYANEIEEIKLPSLRSISWASWKKFLKCVFFHKGSTINNCSLCHNNYFSN